MCCGLGPRFGAVLLWLRKLSLAILRRGHQTGWSAAVAAGVPWGTAAEWTWSALQKSGAVAAAGDDCAPRLLGFAGWAAAAAAALASGLFLDAQARGSVVGLLAIALVSYQSAVLPLTLVEGGASALVAATVQQPGALSQCHPILFHRYLRLSEVRQLRVGYG